MITRRFALLMLAASMLLPFAARAESVVWTSTDNPSLCGDYQGPYNQTVMTGSGPLYLATYSTPGVEGCWTLFYGVITIVQYHAHIENTSTGEVLGCGATVAQGTPLMLVFDAPQLGDISWFDTGTSEDSPYGSFVAGTPAPVNACTDQNYVTALNCTNCIDNPDGYITHYGAMEANPPSRSIDLSTSNVLDCGSADANGNERCTASRTGDVTATFNFAPTTGTMYSGMRISWVNNNACYTDPNPMQYYSQAWTGISQHPHTTGQSFRLDVPQQTISCPITVIAASGLPPTGLTVSGGGAASGAGQCTVGTPYTITMKATDPDHDQLRYGVDWDGNGTVDQFLPSTGYVPSGTQESASRTYSTNGTKTIKVLAQDNRGLTSGWITLSVSCTGQTDQSQNQNNSQSNSGNNQSLQNTLPALTLRAIPSLVRGGQTTTLSWSASNVLGNTCKVTSAVDTAANGQGNWAGAVSQGVTSSAITQQTTYTLTCTGLDNSTLTQSATVNIIPSFQEK